MSKQDNTRKNRPTKPSTNNFRGRLRFVSLVLAFFVPLVLIARLFQIQIIEGEHYQKSALRQQVSTNVINAQRGTIYDRNMKALARSATVWTIVMNPRNISGDEERELLADTLSELLEVDREKIINQSKREKSQYEVIKTKVEKETADKVLEFVNSNKFTCIDLIEDSKRYYPYGSLASTVIGFTDYENNGAYGIESYYNKVLSGTPGRVTSAKTGWQTDMDFRYQKMYDASDGNSLVLTIDEVIQHSLERNLETAVIEHGIKKRAVGIVMDVNTGEILAMATKGDFDPNNPNVIQDPVKKAKLDEMKKAAEALEESSGEEAAKQAFDDYREALQQAQFEQWSNKCITDPMEPGSVFKIVTASAGLESGTSTVNSNFVCSGAIHVAGWNISCWKTGGHGAQDFKHALMHSCNPAFIMIGQSMGIHTFCNFFDAFGMNEPTGIDLPGEANGVHHEESNMGIVELSSSSFGQTFKVTPIQMVTAVSAAVNGGNLVQPHVVKQILDADNNVVETVQTTVKRQVISEDTSAKIRDMMEGVVSGDTGSGKSAYIPGYRIGGKTGTSEKLDLYDENGVRIVEYGLSFVGVAPIDAPEIAVYVMLDEPTSVGYGSVIAAPIVQSVLKEILPYMGFEPQYSQAELSQMEITVPFVIGEVTHGATSKITLQGLNPEIIGTGSTVIRQVPEGGAKMPRGGKVLLYTEQEENTTVTVPDVIGMAGQLANKTLVNAGLNVRLSGVLADQATDVVVKQDPSPGRTVEEGTVVTISFSNTTPAPSVSSQPVLNIPADANAEEQPKQETEQVQESEPKEEEKEEQETANNKRKRKQTDDEKKTDADGDGVFVSGVN